jgi:hypothetical protein
MNRGALLKKRVAEQGFTTRTCNCLRLAGIETVEDLVTVEKYQLFCTKGLGKKTLKEIEEFLSEHDLRLGMNHENTIRMAKEAGFEYFGIRQLGILERFAALVAAAEREACASILDQNVAVCGTNSAMRDVLAGNALAIRARDYDHFGELTALRAAAQMQQRIDELKTAAAVRERVRD